MLSQDPGSETQFIIMIFLIAVSVFGLMLIGAVIATLSQIRSRGKPVQKSSTGPPALSSEEAAPQEESPSAVETTQEIESTHPSPLSDHINSPGDHERELIEEAAFAAEAASEVELTPGSPLNERTETHPEQAREPIGTETWSTRQILGIALTGALMMASVLDVPQVLMAGDSSAYRALVFLPLWTAAAGAIGFRAAKLSWRQTVLSAVVVGAALLVVAGFQGMWSPERFLLLGMSRGVMWANSGVFLLPLFDPAVRKMGPAPSRWQVVATALALALSAPFLFLWAQSYDIWKGLSLVVLMPGLPLIPSSILLMSGLILALLAPRSVAGSWIGGVGILFSYCIYFGRFVLLFLSPPMF